MEGQFGFDSESLTSSDGDSQSIGSTDSFEEHNDGNSENVDDSSVQDTRLASSSWTIQDSMDTDYFFLIPPAAYSGLANGRGNRIRGGSFVMPATELRRSNGTFNPPPAQPTLVPMAPDETIDCNSRSLPSPRAVATHDINCCDPIADPIVYDQVSTDEHLHRSTLDGKGRRGEEEETDGGDDDDATPFRNLYQDNDSLYFDDDCLTEYMTEPPYKPDKVFVTSKKAADMTWTHTASPISVVVQLWRNLMSGCCLPTRKLRHSVAAVPSSDMRHHRHCHQRSYSDPNLLIERLDEQHILTKKTIERSRQETDGAVTSVPPSVKFRPSRNLLMHELIPHIDSDAMFVFDDTFSLPDDVMMPSSEE